MLTQPSLEKQSQGINAMILGDCLDEKSYDFLQVDCYCATQKWFLPILRKCLQS
jgi:hypothetical protein